MTGQHLYSLLPYFFRPSYLFLAYIHILLNLPAASMHKHYGHSDPHKCSEHSEHYCEWHHVFREA